MTFHCVKCCRTGRGGGITISVIKKERREELAKHAIDITENMRNDIISGKLNGQRLCGSHAPGFIEAKRKRREEKENPQRRKQMRDRKKQDVYRREAEILAKHLGAFANYSNPNDSTGAFVNDSTYSTGGIAMDSNCSTTRELKVEPEDETDGF